jgi:hypothetical protein
MRAKRPTWPTHNPIGDPCAECGVEASEHRPRYHERVKRTIEGVEREVVPYTFLGLDGEGQGRKDHRYVLLAASDENGNFKDYIEASNVRKGRLTTIECLDFLLGLPKERTKVFSYSFGYDLTKILTDCDNGTLYLLMRPELRARSKKYAHLGPKPVFWPHPQQGPYSLNFQGTKFTVKRGGLRCVVWDIFKFYGGPFVQALKDWRVGTKELVDRMTAMKAKRQDFDKLSPDAVREYCFEECQCMAELARRLVEAHDAIELKLTSFYGAGSSGAAMLKVMGIHECVRPVPKPMQSAVAMAFFGGRFEHSVVGPVDTYLYGKDISSAYPYQTTFLPCLEHGTWKLSESEQEARKAKFALVNYTLRGTPKVETSHGPQAPDSWGPFPFRDTEGNICYPIQSGGGWVWGAEFFAGQRVFRHARFVEAWVYDCACKCQPFAAIPRYYLKRLAIGKEGPGIVIKLGVNSVYGKLAQSVGNALFNNWIWAGLITSGCRAQILGLMWLHKKLSNLLMIATDGIFTREKIDSPAPRDTGTAEGLNEKGETVRKPLGGWEDKDAKRGLFFARPGIYFPINPTDAEIKDIKARGLGRTAVLKHWKKIVSSWKRHGVTRPVRVDNVVRFCGVKTSIHASCKGFSRAKGTDGISPSYGQWIERPVEMDFSPMPKRAGVNPDGLTLTLRRFGSEATSAPYDRAIARMLASNAELREAGEQLDEQPDGGIVESYE